MADEVNGQEPGTWPRPPGKLVVFGTLSLVPFAYGVFRLANAGHGGRRQAALVLLLGAVLGALAGWFGRGYVKRAVHLRLRGSVSDVPDALVGIVLIGFVVLAYMPLILLEAGMGLASGIAGVEAARIAIRWWPLRYAQL